MISVIEARDAILNRIRPIGVERVDSLSAQGRVLAEAVHATRNQPALGQFGHGRLCGSGCGHGACVVGYSSGTGDRRKTCRPVTWRNGPSERDRRYTS